MSDENPPPFLTSATLAVAFSFPAQAQQACAPRDDVIKRMNTQYGETLVSQGTANNGWIVEVMTSESGSWTIFTTRGAVSCLVATGERWRNLPAETPGSDS